MIRSRCRITFDGLNVARTLNQLSKVTALINVSRQGKRCQITVPYASRKQVVAFLQERCYNIIDVERIGFSAAKAFLRVHFVLPLFIALAVVVCAVSSNFCWNVEVSGDYDASTVLEALNGLEVGVGRSLFGFDADKLENQLAVKLDAMYAVVNRKGSALYVNVVKSKQADKPIDMHSRRDIVATCSGRVTDVLCEQGTPVVKAGDEVKKGDPLIVGLRTFSDGTTEHVYALGCVTLEQSCTAFAPYTGFADKTVDTGKTFTANRVVLFQNDYGKKPPFATFREECESIRLAPLNLEIKRITYYETQKVSLPATFDECFEQLKSQALEEATANANFVVARTDCRVSEGGVTVTLFGETQIK
ncbi:MAG: sporulation protein YqfD [Corallococcus sp.]|nr:sporulation protein YqfD [Corallococcus sp.]MCM1359837.1 sporulation protein YqfD [Corallococcus sp.]MCM1395271.1 sporulation protein YqfD [Corallococcus sp.]